MDEVVFFDVFVSGAMYKKEEHSVQQITIFLDDGGVMNDNSKRASQWQHLVSEFLVPRLGGTGEAWVEANRIVADRLLNLESWNVRLQAAGDYARFDHDYQIDWLKGMCELVGVPAPSDEACFDLAHQATAYVTSRVHAAFPGVVEAIRCLHSQGYTLYTASGEASLDLAGYLEAMGVRACFKRLYGPDLVDTFKSSPAYYERIFADVGIAPSEALIVDDSPFAINWAAQLGARTVLVGNALYPPCRAMLRIAALSELPALLPQIDEKGAELY